MTKLKKGPGHKILRDHNSWRAYYTHQRVLLVLDPDPQSSAREGNSHEVYVSEDGAQWATLPPRTSIITG